MQERNVKQRWALVLAAGDGTRLASLTRDREGRRTPKQFCSVYGGPTLLQETLSRGARLAGVERTVAVVAAGHDRWWRDDTAMLHPGNVVVQPLNRGTAAGILLPLLRIAAHDPQASVVVLPSDHFIENEVLLEGAIREAFAGLSRERDALILLGIGADRPDPELGWIVPAWSGGRSAVPVERFVEKPPREVAATLMRRGALWNSFIFVARVARLIELYRDALPGVLEQLERAVTWEELYSPEVGALETVYAGLESRDFSRDVLERHSRTLRVLPVPPCGWNDLGTPERLARSTAGRAPAPRRTVEWAAGAPTLPVGRPVLALAV